MKSFLFCVPIFISFLLLQKVAAAPDAGTSPQEVITRLILNASKKPLGPVENDVTEQTVKTVKTLESDPHFKDAAGSFRGDIAFEYNQFTLEGPLESLYLEGSAALFHGKVKLTSDALTTIKQDSGQGTVGFGESGGFSMFIDSKVKDDGDVVATFCLVQQHGLWKVHGVYLSNEPITGTNKDFIIRQLVAFAKKT